MASISATAPLIALSARSRSLGGLTHSLDSSLTLDNDAELSAPEFVQFVGRVADVRVPADRRGATPFEETLDAWLGLQLVPACRKAVQARGGRWHTDA